MPRPKRNPRDLRYLTLAKHAGRFPHGTPARYVAGCRCDDCHRGLRELRRKRTEAVRAAAAEVQPNEGGYFVLVANGMRHGKWRAHRVGQCDGCGSRDVDVMQLQKPTTKICQPCHRELWAIQQQTMVVRRRLCPGTGGNPCVYPGCSWLKKGELCMRCVERATVWNGLVDAAPARRHLRAFGRAHVGYKVVADAAKVAASLVQGVRRGTITRVRAHTLKRILAVEISDAAAIRADGEKIRSTRSHELLDKLYARGASRVWVAAQIGVQQQMLCPRRRARHPWFRVATVARIERLWRRVRKHEIELQRRFVDPAPTQAVIDKLLAMGFTKKLLRERIGVRIALLTGKPTSRIRPATAEKIAAFYRSVTLIARKPKKEEPDLFAPRDEDQVRRRLLEAYADGVVIEDLERRFDLSASNIMQIASRAGVRRPGDNAGDDQDLAIEESLPVIERVANERELRGLARSSA